MNPDTELEWTGFLDALEHTDDGLLILDHQDDYRSRYMDGQRNMCVIPADYVLDTAGWRPILGHGFKKVIFAFRNRSRLVPLMRSAIKLDKPPELLVDTGANGEQPAYSWLADTHNAIAKGDDDKLLDLAYEFDNGVSDPFEMDLVRRDYWPVIRSYIDLLDDEILIKYEAYDHKSRQRQSNRILNRAINDAQKQIANGEIERAQATVLAGYQAANKAFTPKVNKNVATMADGWDDWAKRIAKWRGRPVIGFETDLTILTDCLMGLRGLVLIAADPNLGKTILVLQMAIQALQRHPDACCVFLSLEMHKDDLFTRAASAEIDEAWRSYVTFGTDEKILKSKLALGNVPDRLSILDRNEVDAGESGIIDHAEALRTRTGCTRTMIVVDYLQVWDAPAAIEAAFRTDLEADKWRIEAMKRLKNSLQREDALLVISEINKKEKEDGRLTNQHIMGSARLPYSADTILLWQKLTIEDKFKWIIPSAGGIAARQYAQKIKDVKKAEMQEWAEECDTICKAMNT